METGGGIIINKLLLVIYQLVFGKKRQLRAQLVFKTPHKNINNLPGSLYLRGSEWILA